MLFGPFNWLFWVFQIGIGTVIPLTILFHPGAKKSVRGVVTASALIVIGVFVKRYYLVIPGAAYPLHLYPGQVEGVWGEVGFFPLMPVEVFLSLGIVALLGLVYLVGLRHFELLPAKEEAGETKKVEAKGS